MKVRENILVVDDKPDNLRLLSNILTSEGYKVRKVLNGRLAIDAAQLDPPDLILLDIMMPSPDGYEVCQSLKDNPKTQEIPVIFLSALDTVSDKVRAFTIGGVDYITKPFQREEVIARVKTHLQLRKLNQTLQQSNLRLRQEIQQRLQIEAELNQTLQELKDTQAQIIVKEKLASLGALMAGIAHELRNPLNFVNNYAEGSVELLQDMALELSHQMQIESASRELLQDLLNEVRDNAIAIHQHGRRAERIICSMMQHTRTEPGERQLIQLNRLLEEAINLVYHSRRAQSDLSVTILTNFDTNLQPVLVLPNDLSRAFINLIDNAYYATAQKCLAQNHAAQYHMIQNHDQTPPQTPEAVFQPTIWIMTRQLPEQIEIKIRDNGVGIPSEVQHQIFDPFFTTKANEGTGLGLSITHDIIVEQHRGTILVQSEFDVYTEFVLTLPLSIP